MMRHLVAISAASLLLASSAVPAEIQEPNPPAACTLFVTVTIHKMPGSQKMRRVEAEFYNDMRAKKDCEVVKARFDATAWPEFFTQCSCKDLKADF